MKELELPDGWIKAKVNEISTNSNNLRKPVSVVEREKIQGAFPYYGATGQIDSLNDFTHEGEYILIGEDGANLLSKSKPLSFIVDGKYWVNNHAHSIKGAGGIPNRFLSHYINSLDLSPWVTGSAQPKLTRGNLDVIPVPLPPLAEQQVIADKLDTLLAQVESIKARLESISEILKQFRQSVLAVAVSGKFTEEQTTDLGWRKMETFALDIRYGTSKKCDPDSGETPVLRIPNIGSGYIDLSDLKYADFDQKELQSLKLKQDDLLIIRSNGSVDLVGKIAIVTKNEEHCLFAGYLIRLRLDGDVVDPKYVAYCLQSPQLRQVIELIARSTSGVNNINSKELLGLEIPVPALEEQRQIVQQIKKLHSLSDVIEDQVLSALDRVNNLTQSILAKAFCGELTAEWREANPDLISGENSTEAFLEKIKAERELAKSMIKHGQGKT